MELEVCESLGVEALGAEVLERGRVHGVAEVRQQELQHPHRRKALTCKGGGLLESKKR